MITSSSITHALTRYSLANYDIWEPDQLRLRLLDHLELVFLDEAIDLNVLLEGFIPLKIFIVDL